MHKTSNLVQSAGLANVDGIFRKYNLAQVRALEKKTRQNIDEAVSMVKSLVGEKYPQILEAAGCIEELKKTSVLLMSTCNTLQKDLPANLPLTSEIIVEEPVEDEFLVAARLRMYTEIPEMIHELLKSDLYYLAAKYYCLASYIELEYSHMLINSPFLATINGLLTPLPFEIRQKAKIAFFDYRIDAQEFGQTICCILTFPSEPDKLELLLDSLFEKRIEKLREQFSENLVNTPTVAQVAQIFLSALEIIRQTIYHIVNTFRPGQLVDVYQELEMFDQALLESLLGESDYLIFSGLMGGMESLTDFPSKPLPPEIAGAEISMVKEKLERWWLEVSRVMEDRVRQTLEKSIDSAKNLCKVRELILPGLRHPFWQESKSDLMEKLSFSPWDDLLRKPVNSRFRQLALDAFSSSKSVVDEILQQLQTDAVAAEQFLGSYAWDLVGGGEVGLEQRREGLCPSILALSLKWEQSFLHLLDDFLLAFEENLENDGENKSVFLEKWDREDLAAIIQQKAFESIEAFQAKLRDCLGEEDLSATSATVLEDQTLNRVLALSRLAWRCSKSELFPRLTGIRKNLPSETLGMRFFKIYEDASERWLNHLARFTAAQLNTFLTGKSDWVNLVSLQHGWEGESWPLKPTAITANAVIGLAFAFHRINGPRIDQEGLRDRLKKKITLLLDFSSLEVSEIGRPGKLQLLFDLLYLKRIFQDLDLDDFINTRLAVVSSRVFLLPLMMGKGTRRFIKSKMECSNRNIKKFFTTGDYW